MVPVDSDHPAHAGMFKTLDLLALDRAQGNPVYFVIGVCAELCELDKLQEHLEYYYEEHTCPTNFIRVPMIAVDGDTDPHGIFRFVRSVWMTPGYDKDDDDFLLRTFPEISGGNEAEKKKGAARG